MFNLNSGMATELIKELVLPNRQLQFNPYFAIQVVKSVHKGLGSVSYLGPKVLELPSLEIKEKETLFKFKTEIKKWNLENRPCRLCKVYLQNVEFI